MCRIYHNSGLSKNIARQLYSNKWKMNSSKWFMFHETWLWPEPDNKFLMTLFFGTNFFYGSFRVANDSFQNCRYWCTATDHTKSNTHAFQAQVSVRENIPNTISVNEKKKKQVYLHANHSVMSLPDAMQYSGWCFQFQVKTQPFNKIRINNDWTVYITYKVQYDEKRQRMSERCWVRRTKWLRAKLEKNHTWPSNFWSVNFYIYTIWYYMHDDKRGRWIIIV